jgi:hypothetical protein
MEQARDVEQHLARHAASMTWDCLPVEAKRQAVRATLWWAATALEGSLGSQQQQLRTYAVRAGGLPEATMLGSESRVCSRNMRDSSTGEPVRPWKARTST